MKSATVQPDIGRVYTFWQDSERLRSRGEKSEIATAVVSAAWDSRAQTVVHRCDSDIRLLLLEDPIVTCVKL